MRKLKRFLNMIANGLHGLAFVFRHWIVFSIALSVFSPITPHLRLPYAAMNDDCAYIGLRGLVRDPAGPCRDLKFIDTRKHEGLLW